MFVSISISKIFKKLSYNFKFWFPFPIFKACYQHCTYFSSHTNAKVYFFAGMKNGRSALSLFTHDVTGGIIDDFIVTKISDEELFVVSNASRRAVDKRLISQKLVRN